MTLRDDFPPEVKRALSARAGHQCSMCGKPTSGPGSEAESALSDGVAAHITAAAPGGPRFDPGLSSAERRSADNGIWVCTQHGREIDADTPAFTVDLLRGRKRYREEIARRELQRVSESIDRSAVLIDLPHAETALKLFEVVAPQAYTFATTSSTRTLLKSAKQPSRILDLAPEVIIETWNSHPNVAGILATLLSNNIDLWRPEPAIISKLQDLCNIAINSGDWMKVAAIEPLAFAISGKGYPDVHRAVLERLINEPHWRDEDAARVRRYYGSLGNQVAAIFRHWNDEFRGGLLRANDVPRVIDLLLSNDEILSKGHGRQTLLDLLVDHAVVLRDAGEFELAKTVMAFVEGFPSPGSK